MFSLKNLSVSISEKSILRGLNYDFAEGKTTAILGHTGSGKSSLAHSLMGHPRYISSGSLLFRGENIISLSPAQRQKKGIFLSFQSIPEIPGIKLMEYLRTVYNERFTHVHPWEKIPTPFVFRRMIEKMMPDIGLDVSFLERDLFVWFSGGEKRRIEILQIALLEPECIILDEIDAGLDIDAISFLRDSIDTWKTKGKTIIIITHNFHLLDSIMVDNIIIMKDGQIVKQGERNLVEEIRKTGFQD